MDREDPVAIRVRVKHAARPCKAVFIDREIAERKHEHVHTAGGKPHIIPGAVFILAVRVLPLYEALFLERFIPAPLLCDVMVARGGNEGNVPERIDRGADA